MRRFSKLTVLVLVLLFSIPHSAAALAQNDISAEFAVLIEAESGDIIWSKNENTRAPQASTTKIMTALIAIETSSDLSRTVVIDPSACGVEGSSVYLTAGEHITMEALVYALLLESANDAAEAIACEIAGGTEEFAELMNIKAAQLGLNGTHFTNPHGLDNEFHYTTALDLAMLARSAMQNETFRKIVGTKKILIDSENGTKRLLLNHNRMLKIYDGATGVKTGFTRRSGRCLVTSASRGGVELISVTLNAPSDWNDHTKLLDYGFSLYERRTLAEVGQYKYSVPIIGSKTTNIICENTAAVEVTLPKSAQLVETIELPRFAYAGISEKDTLGYIIWSRDGKEIARTPLCAQSSSEPLKYPSFWEKILYFFGIRKIK